MTPEKGITILSIVTILIFIISYIFQSRIIYLFGYFVFVLGLLVVVYYCKDQK